MEKVNLIEFINELNKKINSKCEDMESSDLSELHIHKILYFQYGMFYKTFKKELFNPDFEAWQYGPVEINYRKYKHDKAKIEEHFTTSLEPKEAKYLRKLTDDLIKCSPWYLADFSHTTMPWFDNYELDKKNSKIPAIEIQEGFEFVNM